MKNTLSVWIGELIAFIRDKNNPTKVTAAQVDTYTKDEIKALVAPKLDLVDFPIAYWGPSLNFPISVVSAPSPDSANLYIQTQVPSILGGVRKTMPGTSLALLTDGVHYIYLRAENGDLNYFDYQTYQPESSTLMYLGSVSVSGRTVSNINIGPVVCLGGKRLSTVKQGSSIPVTSGGANEPGTFPWD